MRRLGWIRSTGSLFELRTRVFTLTLSHGFKRKNWNAIVLRKRRGGIGRSRFETSS